MAATSLQAPSGHGGLSTLLVPFKPHAITGYSTGTKWPWRSINPASSFQTSCHHRIFYRRFAFHLLLGLQLFSSNAISLSWSGLRWSDRLLIITLDCFRHWVMPATTTISASEYSKLIPMCSTGRPKSSSLYA